MEIKVFLNPLLKWWWLILTAALLAATASFFANRQVPVLYQSRSTLLIGSPFSSLNPNANELNLSLTLAETYARFAYREPVREATMAALGLEWLPEYTATSPLNTQFVEISVVDTNPQRAQMVANELANQLIQLSPGGENQGENNRQGFINQQLDDLQRQIQETKIEVETQQIELGNYVSAREIANAQKQIEALQSKLSSLQLNYATLLSKSENQATNTLTIIEPALLPQNPIDPQTEMTILLSALLGAFLAAAAAFLLEYLNDNIESADELQLMADIPVLSSIPHSKLVKKDLLITLEQPRAPISEIFRDLRTRVQFSELDRSNRTILVASANSGEGKSFVAANLAYILAYSGFKTLLIDADLRVPDQHKIFELNNEYGLADILRNPGNLINHDEIFSDLEGCVSKIPGVSLDVITRGTFFNNPSELLGSPTMKELLEHVAKQYDYVLIDSAPSLSLTDSLIISRQVGGVLLVVSAKGTRRNQVKTLVSRFRDVNANLIGFALNNLAQKNIGYYYGYSYGDSHESPAKTEKKSRKGWGKNKQITEKLAKE